ncbi:hypothetical protein PR202_ga15736 [Eleusine coracana subsp. coracana]|uniref:Uncharacterized protein n=1 Tax=Eleusine coracana subsp. coracana TaxID=191504 RepID=A0AAV5CKN7_ELECO|nr:hypothetical protein PR202_ga15736 [Eleusine coracana subsp. coracana]
MAVDAAAVSSPRATAAAVAAAAAASGAAQVVSSPRRGGVRGLVSAPPAVASGGGRALIQGVPRRGLGAGLRARLPVAEHLRGPRAALHAPADARCRSARRRRWGQWVASPPVYDLREFGAVGDGRTVNTAAFEAAVAAIAERGGGRTHRAHRPVAHGALQSHQPHDALPCLRS